MNKTILFLTFAQIKIIQNQSYEKDILFKLPFDDGKLHFCLCANSRSSPIQD